MNPILSLLKSQAVPEEKIHAIFEELTTNPLQAMTTIGQLGIPPELLQPVMMQVMANPALIKEAVEELGLDVEAMEKAKQSLKDNN